MSKMTVTADAKPMLNAYPDSVGGTLSDITGFLQKPELKDVFSSFSQGEVYFKRFWN